MNSTLLATSPQMNADINSTNTFPVVHPHASITNCYSTQRIDPMNTISMINLRPRLLKALVAPMAAAILMALPTASPAAIILSVNIAPPEIPVYVQPPLPGDGYIWTPGYWAYADEGYFWVPGTWVRPPSVGLLWTPGYWGYEGGRYAFRSGYWGSSVGFYGGINYGYGYGGRGYEGGYWNRGAFYYNRNVNTIGTISIRNVYNKTVINNVTINRVSFNGGPGGLSVRASTVEQRAEHERHVQANAEQQRQVEMASQNKALFAAVNHGAPPVAATPKAGVFDGPGVVKARDASANTAATAPGSKPNGVDAKSDTVAGKATSVDAKANAEAAKTARQDARAKAQAARAERQDAKMKSQSGNTDRTDTQRNPEARRAQGPRPNADANGMQSDNPRPNQRGDAQNPARADRPAQGARPANPSNRTEPARKAPPAASNENDKTKEEGQKQQ